MPRYYGSRRYGYGPGAGWGWGRGRGFGYGGRYGGGGGWCWWPRRPWCRGWAGWSPPWAAGPYGPEPYWEEPPYETPREEIEDLKEEEAFLKGELEAIQKRLAELEKEA
jgi:hypothetical protein